MTVIREWASALLAAGVGCALLCMVCPAGSIQRAMQVVTALLMLCALLSPLSTLVSSLQNGFVFQEDQEVPVTLRETVDEQSIAFIEETLYNDACERLRDTEASVKAIHIKRDNTAVDCIYIQSIRVVFSKEDHPVSDAVVKQLEQAWGVPVEVYYIDE